VIARDICVNKLLSLTHYSVFKRTVKTFIWLVRDFIRTLKSFDLTMEQKGPYSHETIQLFTEGCKNFHQDNEKSRPDSGMKWPMGLPKVFSLDAENC
jgi:hypothetical protein